jgi:hypothetical protein
MIKITTKQKIYKFALLLICLVFPIGILEFLSHKGIDNPFPIFILTGSSILMFITAVSELRRPVLFLNIFYILILIFWAFSQDLRTAQDLIYYLRENNISIAHVNKPDTINIIELKNKKILKIPYSLRINKDKYLIFEKHFSYNRAVHYKEKQKKKGATCCSNGFWTMTLFSPLKKDRFSHINLKGNYKDQFDELYNKFILW